MENIKKIEPISRIEIYLDNIQKSIEKLETQIEELKEIMKGEDENV